MDTWWAITAYVACLVGMFVLFYVLFRLDARRPK